VPCGYLGEGLPYSIWRCDHRNGWSGVPPQYPAKKKLAEYLQENFWITTSGNFRTQTLTEIWANFRRAWRDPRVAAFVDELAADPGRTRSLHQWVHL